MDWITKMNGYCARIAGNRADAEDLAQDACLKIVAALRDEPNRRITNAFLYRVALNAWKDKLKKTRRDPVPLERDLEQASPDSGPNARELLEVLVERLSPRMAVVLLLMDVFGFTAKETAEFVSSTEAALQVNLGRARKRLKRLAERYPLHQAPPPEERRASGNETLDFEALVEAFRRRDPHALHRAYVGLSREGIRVESLRRTGDAYRITFRDPDDNLFTVIA